MTLSTKLFLCENVPLCKKVHIFPVPISNIENKLQIVFNLDYIKSSNLQSVFSFYKRKKINV